jgi:hypothetical protein
VACGRPAVRRSPGGSPQVITYPFDTVKRSMQAGPVELRAPTMRAELRRILAADGSWGTPLTGQGAFRGTWPNLMKITPSVTVAPPRPAAPRPSGSRPPRA